MEKLLRAHHISFKNAFAGLVWAMTTQPNFRIHVSISCIALVLSWYLSISRAEFGVIIFAIVFGLGAEMINTSIESMTDLITKEWNKEAKIAKDVAAGMMLLVACGDTVVGLYILGPRLIHLFN